jgi:hypothetical protein
MRGKTITMSIHVDHIGIRSAIVATVGKNKKYGINIPADHLTARTGPSFSINGRKKIN